KRVFTQTIIEIVHSGKEIRFVYKGFPATRGTVGVMLPNVAPEEVTTPLLRKTGKPSPHDVEPRLLTKDEAGDLSTGKAFVIIRSLVIYDDIFNIHHWTKACAFSAFASGAY